ncbi:coagulation factor 5/8 type domain protein [Pedosphaera parvula Ellin514]|uniref:Coagulation factor 5/8 type domain protein n=2 Tax=Pedosphaera TaxID=1032526 RepID=B9XK67_PEDPL|nr:coagulation factor 5/8 type domain protein [Pedosphaera parvula Ellin514]
MIRMQANSHTQTAMHSISWLCLSLSSVLLFGSIASAEDLVPLKPKLPMAKFVGTPKETPPGTTAGAIDDKPQAPLMIPKDAVNIAPGKSITTSDTNSSPAVLKKIVDGNKEATDDAVILLRKGRQWIQFDLGAPQEVFAIVVWHAHDVPKVYHDVVAQIADDAAFTKNVRTIFNNDTDNSSGLGVGTDREYFETNSGRTFDAKGEKAQFVRLYSKGNTDSSLNEYTEVEIYGRPVK